MKVYIAQLIVIDGYWGALVLDYHLFSKRGDAEKFIKKEKGVWEIVEKTIS